MTKQLTDVQERLNKFRRHIAFVRKSGTNTHFKYKFATVEDVTTAVSEGLEMFSLCLVSQQIVDVSRWIVGDMSHTQCRIKVGVGCGDEIYYFEGMGEGCDRGDKGSMKSMASAVKYAYKGLGLITFGDDPEADESTDAPVAPIKPETVHAAIARAKSKVQLTAVRNMVLTLRGAPEYDDLVRAYQTRDTILTAVESAPGE
jgi:hypothetical protein